MQSYEQAVNSHYSRQNLGDMILSALQKAGKNTKNLTRGDLKAIDEFHTRGLDATQELARMANVQPNMKVLDLGCGIGGPARLLADEFGCNVTGVDIVDEYCQAAMLLTKRVGLDGKVQFKTADMMNLGFDGGMFDMVWSQHSLMNISDKRRLFDVVFHMLRPGGRYACYEICSGSVNSLYFPVPWASDASINFLVSPQALANDVKGAGFVEKEWEDVTAMSLAWFKNIVSQAAARPADVPPPPGLNLLMGETTGAKLKNVILNLEEDKIRIIRGVFEKPTN